MATNRETESVQKSGSSEPNRNPASGPTMHKAPSMFWFFVPLVLLMAYGYFTR